MNKYECLKVLKVDTAKQRDALNELVERATPKKVLNIHETYSTTLGTCPVCDSTIPYGWKYCAVDGHALDWGDIDE